jgi:TolB-like protein
MTGCPLPLHRWRVTGRIVAMVRSIAFLVAAALGAVAFAGPGAAPKTKPTVAVLAFDYGGKDPALDPLREGLAQMLITDVSGFASVNVVERAKLKALLEEQKLGRSGKVDPATATRVGKLLGARFLVLGNYFDLGPSIRIDARVVEVETGKVVRGVGVNGASADFLGIEQDLANKLIDVIAGALPEPAQVDRPARAKPGKVKSTTVATYGRALLALDDGKKPEAKTLLKQVVSEAPEFQLAKADLNALLQ